MKLPPTTWRTLKLLALVLPLIGLFIYTALRSGPLAPVPVVLATVEERALAPMRFGIGTVESGASYQIGPTAPGRLKRLEVEVGDRVRAGQVLGEMDPVDLDQRLRAQAAALSRVQAQLHEAEARLAFAEKQAARYAELFSAGAVTEEMRAAKAQDQRLARTQLAAAKEEEARLAAERQATRAQRENLRLVAPAEGLVAARRAEPGTTLVAGQAVLTLVDARRIWVNARFDQSAGSGLAPGEEASIVLRSRASAPVSGHVLRVEPLADAVTEEILAKIAFTQLPQPLPPLGELAEVTVRLPMQPARPTLANAALVRVEGKLGAWQMVDGALRFAPLQVGAGDLDGQVQVHAGLRAGDRVVVYSAKPLKEDSRIQVVERIPGSPS